MVYGGNICKKYEGLWHGRYNIFRNIEQASKKYIGSKFTIDKSQKEGPEKYLDMEEIIIKKKNRKR